jgi:tetratricopeptide (TPR) repeat protein
MRPWTFVAAWGLAVAGARAGARAQVPAPVDTIAEARRLRDASDFAGAAALMRPYVESHPDDAGAARFAALMTYWAKDQRAAGAVYAAALALHPDDAELRLEYGRFLIETGASSRAAGVLEPLVVGEGDSTRIRSGQVAQARTLLGTAAYWRGDYTAARREFATALRLDSTVVDARRQLAEIETAAASWVRLRADLWDDDQPLRSASAGLEGGWFANPLTPLGIRAWSTVFDLDGASESVTIAEASIATYLPAARLDVAARGGVLQRSFGTSTDWTGRFTLGARLPRTMRVDAAYERAPYTNTVRSLARAIMVQTIDGTVHWGTPRGWMAEAAGRREIYPDDNHVSTGFGWILAPLASGDGGTLHLGYGFTARSAESSRFAPRGDAEILLPPGQAPATVPGEYDPYYTPRNLRVHSALATVRLEPNERWTLDASGRYAISAHDDAPVLVVLAAPPTTIVSRGFYRRSFKPWSAAGAVDWAATRAFRVGLGVEHGREAYYAYTTGRVQLTYTFVAAAEQRAGVR